MVYKSGFEKQSDGDRAITSEVYVYAGDTSGLWIVQEGDKLGSFRDGVGWGIQKMPSINDPERVGREFRWEGQPQNN